MEQEKENTLTQEELEQWIQRAEEGDCEMQYQLGEYYYTGAKKDYRRALAYYLQAAETGHLKAQKRASEMYMSGKKIGKDVDEAARWLVLAANQGDIDAQFQLGEYYSTSRKHDYNRALMYYMQAAGGGNTSAMREIGNMYLSKKISGKSSEDAIEWIKLAAEQGDAEAQFQLSRHFYVMEDYENWADFCQQAAEGGCIQAQLDAGLMHMHGIKTRKNTNEAVKWLTMAAEQGEELALRYLLDIYYECNDRESALNWATRGGENCLYSLGLKYLCDKDIENALVCFKKIMEIVKYIWVEGHYEYRVGEDLSEEGYLQEASLWWTQGAEKGLCYSQHRLGECYEQGKGVKQDINQAIHWYTLSAEQGYENAKEALERLAYND